MKPLRDRDQASVGAVTLVLIALALLVAFNADDLPIIGGGTTYTAEFTESAGLRAGNEVRLAGVKVGDVRSVELARNKVVVDFRVDDVSLGDESTVSIEIKTLLGDKYLALASAGATPQRPNDPIPRDRTRTPFDIVPAVGKLADTVDQIDTGQLAKSFAVISDTFANSPKHLRDTLTGLTRLSKTLSTRDDQLKTLLSNTANVSKTVADRDAQLQKLFADASLLLDELSARREAVSTLLSGTTVARRRAVRPGRGQPAAAAARAGRPRAGHHDPAAQPGQPEPEPALAGTVRADVQQRDRQRPLVRGLHLRAAPAADQDRRHRHQPAGLLDSPRPPGRWPVTYRTRSGRSAATVVALACVLGLLVAGALWWVGTTSSGTRITAYFDKAVGVYPDSEVKVLGIGVGRITDVEPRGDRVRVDLVVDDGIEIPAGASAVVVAPSLVSDRYVQLAPAYDGGPLMRSGTTIPMARTDTPVELDDLTKSVNELATSLGPNGANADGALSDVLNTAAANLSGNGELFGDDDRRSCPTRPPRWPTPAATCSPRSTTCRRSPRRSPTATRRSARSTTGWPT